MTKIHLIVLIAVLLAVQAVTIGSAFATDGSTLYSETIPANTTSSVALDKARQLTRALRVSAMKVRDVQSLCLENASQLEQLRQLGADAIPACLDEIADKTSPASLRILLIEIAAVPNGHNDLGLGQTLMVIIGDATGAKAVRMQALQWIPAVGDQSAGVTLLQMLPGQTDPDLEFGVTRALRGFKVPGSLGALQGELADKKTYLTRIVAAHAVAAQGGDDALRLLQDFLVVRMAKSNLGARPEEDAVSIHGIMALGEVPSVTSLPLLQSVLNNPNNSVSLRNTAAETIGAIGGPEASRILRESMAQETNESVLVYVARGLARCGDTEDAQLCLNRRATVNDDFVKSELENAAQALQVKVKE